MQSESLFISNLPPSITEADLHDLFSEVGQIDLLEVRRDPKLGGKRPGARFNLRTTVDPYEILAHYNGIKVDDQPILVTFNSPRDFRRATPQEYELSKKIAEVLQEKARQPFLQITKMTRLCSPAYVEALLELTLKVEEEGGLLVADQSRRRTAGGVFFYLGRRHISYRMQRAIFYVVGNGKKKKKGPATSDKPAKKKASKQEKQPATDRAEYAQLMTLREQLAKAQQDLEKLKAMPSEERSKGLFSATREIVNLQKQITSLLQRHPDLE